MYAAHPAAAKTPHIDDDKCRVCSACMAREACKVKAIVALDRGEPPFVDGSRCHGCMVCIPACPFEAVLS
jgi:MinD superfamily P-loop ATPase